MSVHIIVPIKNEYVALTGFTTEIKNTIRKIDYMITFVDDTDDYEKTFNHIMWSKTRYNIRYLRGVGNYGDSIKWAIANADKYDKLILMDIDHPLIMVNKMIDLLDNYDVVIGNDSNNGIARFVTKMLCNHVAGLNLNHPTCGFIGFNSDVLSLGTKNIWFTLARSKYDIIHVEWMLACRKKNLSIGELGFISSSTIKHNYTWKRCLRWLWDFMIMLIRDMMRIYP